MTACGTLDPDAVVATLIAVGGCSAEALGTGGWQGLAGSSLFAGLLTGLLTVLVAWQGYRLLFGAQSMGIADPAILLVRIGAVIALATTWTAYDRVIYKVATEGPQEIAAALVPSAGIDTSALVGRLQNAYDAIRTVPGGTASELPRSPAQGASDADQAAERQTFAEQDRAGIADRRSSAEVLLVSTAGSWVAVRLGLAVVLAIGPLAIVAALFDATTGLTLGWIRAMLGAALATLTIPIIAAIELEALRGPVVHAARTGSLEIAGLSAIVWSFALVTAAVFLMVWRISAGIELRMTARAIVRAESGTGAHCADNPSAAARAVASRDAYPIIAPASDRARVVVEAVENRSRAPSRSHARATAAPPRFSYPGGDAVRSAAFAEGSPTFHGRRAATPRRSDPKRTKLAVIAGQDMP